MLNIGPQEVLLILLVALVVVGPQRLPELGRTIGKGLRELRRAQDEVRRVVNETLEEPKAATPAATGGTPMQDTPRVDPSRVGETDPISSLADGARKLRRAREEMQRTFRIDRDPR